MNRNMRVIQIIIMLLTSVVLFVFVTLAWFASISKTEPIVINTGSLIAECHFYQGSDANNDGIIEESEYQEITEGDLVFPNIIPGDQFYFKLSITNQGDVAGFLSIRANGIETNYEQLNNAFSFVFNSPDSETIPFTTGSILLFQNYILGKAESYDFFFTVNISGETENTIEGKYVTIDNFTVDLVQYH